MSSFEENKLNKYLIAYTKYKTYFSIETDVATYCTEAATMKEAIQKAKEVCSIIDIISIIKLDDSISWEDIG